MLSKSIIQFSVDGQGCVPSLLFDPRPNYGGGNEDDEDLLQNIPCMYCYTQCPQPCSRPPLSLHWRLLDTHRQVWVSLLWGYCSFLLVSGAHNVLLCPPRVCFPSSVLDYVKVIMLKVVYLNSSLSTLIELCNL